MGRELEGAALAGDLRHFFPTELLQLLQLAQATGRLELKRVGEQAELYVERGHPVFARTSGGSVRAGEILVHLRQLTAAALERALAEQKARPGERLGALLVARGEVTPEQVQGAVRESLRRIVYGLLLWREGRFLFVPDERVEEEDIRLDLDLDRLILEGLRIADQSRAAG
jgi:Domain of unknown function (DUF4388)